MKYKEIKTEILGGSDDEDSDSGSEDSDGEEEEGKFICLASGLRLTVDPSCPDKEGIEDRTETNLINLRRVIYLTIMNSLNYEEAVHKLMKINIQEGQEVSMRPSGRPRNLTEAR